MVSEGVYLCEYTIEPSLFREINTLVKGDKLTYKDVTVEIVDGPSTTGPLHPQPVTTVAKDDSDQEDATEETKEPLKALK